MTELALPPRCSHSAGALATGLARTPARADRVNVAAALLTAAAALALAAVALAAGDRASRRGGW